MVKLNIELPEGFLDEEVRCGYTVTKQMKEVWAVELDLLSEFKRVCEIYNLRYTVSGGTMLGAIRHKGFIPWDDDIDVDMPRSDYNALCKLAIKEFKEPYFWQTEYSDRGSLRGHAQFRRSDTTAILSSEKGLKNFNQGIFIDIFPHDNIPDDNLELEKYISKIKKYKTISGRISKYCNKKYEPKTKSKRILKKIIKPILFIIDRINLAGFYYKKMDNFAQSYNYTKTKKIACSTFIPEEEKNRFPSEYINSTIDVPFEFITVKVSSIYDVILCQKYGDYMRYVIGGSLHGDVIFDTSKSYKEYI